MCQSRTYSVKVNAIDISPLKCATHWLYFCAKEHPEIGLPKIGSKGRDSNFFGTQKYKKGIQVYEQAFKNQKPILYDISAGFYGVRHNQTVEQIYKYNPDILITCMVRDPVDRAVSHYKYYYRNRYQGNIPSFKEAFEKNIAGIQSCGKITSGILHFLQRFRREQMFITKFEEFRTNQEKYLRALFSFLGIAADFKPKVLNYQHWKKITDTHNYYASDKVKAAIKIPSVDFVKQYYEQEYDKIKRIEFDDFLSI